MSTENIPGPMTEAERDTVARNLGLVGMQIKRLLDRGVPDAHVPEYREELFQEGCLGLMQAVRTYDPGSGMSFATYAMPRIHYAAWRALRRYRETIRLPERHARSKSTPAKDGDSDGSLRVHRRPKRMGPGDTCTSRDGEARAETRRAVDPVAGRRCRDRRRSGGNGRSPAGLPGPNLPRVHSCTPEEMEALPDRSDCRQAANGRPDAACGGEPATIGGMLRRKLEAAVDAAVQQLSAVTKSRGDRRLLARTLADQRLLVPEAGFQASLRAIARSTRSSYGRVAACEALLVAEVRRLLAADVEFELLYQAGARRRDGMAAVIDDGFRDALREGVIARLIGVFARLPRANRADVLLTVLEKAGADIAALLRAHANDLSDGDRSRLLATSCGGAASGRRTREPRCSGAVAGAR